ncbi:unnamed protein product [Bemisia tabaci]|uniref:Ubiquitin-like domain-containing protein n=1 Tax=Bemisia tabaci TaxID=7038 RepID=A0A9P0EYW5_BEMTA|nr:PREDICTED: ubiquitin-like protein 4A [Bemisia tabaci]CAH0382634.1 unnamed protein product [Bemisia tabaci]
MKISVKIIKGSECTIEVQEDMSIAEMKQIVSNNLQIPVASQKLVYLGKPLSNEKRVRDYPQIKDGSKLICTVLPSTVTQKQPDDQNVLKNAMYKFLTNYYSAADALKILTPFMKEMDTSMSSLSLDDLERFAVTYGSEEKLTT